MVFRTGRAIAHFKTLAVGKDDSTTPLRLAEDLVEGRAGPKD
jgi:hypothetical protein